MSIVFSWITLYTLVYALFIALHDYPEKGDIQKVYDTVFLPLKDPTGEPLEDPSEEK